MDVNAIIKNKLEQLQVLEIKALKQLNGPMGIIPNPYYQYLTEDLCLAIVRADGSLLGSFPPEFLTPEVCRVAVANDWQAIQFVPLPLRIKQLCREAMELSEGSAVFYLPKDLMTPEFLLSYTPYLPRIVFLLGGVGLTEEVLIEAVKQDWLSILSVPSDKRTEALEKEAYLRSKSSYKFLSQCTVEPPPPLSMSMVSLKYL